jgi:hypothetical protein
MDYVYIFMPSASVCWVFEFGVEAEELGSGLGWGWVGTERELTGNFCER